MPSVHDFIKTHTVTQHTVDSLEFGETKSNWFIPENIFSLVIVVKDTSLNCVWGFFGLCFNNKSLVDTVLLVISRQIFSGTTEIKLERKKIQKLTERSPLINRNVKWPSSNRHSIPEKSAWRPRSTLLYQMNQKLRLCSPKSLSQQWYKRRKVTKGMEAVKVDPIKKRKVCGSISMAGAYISRYKNNLELLYWFTEEFTNFPWTRVVGCVRWD